MMKRALLFVLAVAGWAQAPAPIRGFSASELPGQVQREQKARAMPSPERLRGYMDRMASAPHAAGSAGSKAVAEYALSQFQDWGLDAHIETFNPLIPYPTERLIELQDPTPARLSLIEAAIPEDPDTAATDQLPLFNAYAASGDVTAQMVYVNYGTPEDYAWLENAGVSVKGKIVIARYGRVWRGLKPKLAQDHGAIGCIIYSDPRDDGFFIDNPYPDGPMRPSQGGQRGSVMDMALYTGDPLTPGWASEPGAKRLDPAEARTLLKIPSLPISWSDARRLLERLQGPLAPEGWRGALPITYHLGPSNVAVRMKLDFDWSNKELYNVIVTIPGESQANEWILYGNHHDAWVNGASDPISGAAALMETARALSLLVKQGWQPKRTIKLALWDGEEFGLIGSTEWVEKHAEELRKTGAVYLNTDSSGTGMMSTAGSTSLETFIDEVLRDVMDPRTGRSILDSLNPAPPGQPAQDAPLGALGSGSDYVAFLHHLGIASLNLGFGAPPGQYHSIYDTVRFFNRFSDTDRRYGIALTQVMVTALLRLADAGALPFAFEPLRSSLVRHIDEIYNMVPPGVEVPHHEALIAEVRKIADASRDFEAAYAEAVERGGVPAKVNEEIAHIEQAFLADDGLPNRDWYKHQLYAPGLLTGYAAKTIPGIREAVEAKDWSAAGKQAQRLMETLDRAAKKIETAARHLRENPRETR